MVASAATSAAKTPELAPGRPRDRATVGDAAPTRFMVVGWRGGARGARGPPGVVRARESEGIGACAAATAPRHAAARGPPRQCGERGAAAAGCRSRGSDEGGRAARPPPSSHQRPRWLQARTARPGIRLAPSSPTHARATPLPPRSPRHERRPAARAARRPPPTPQAVSAAGRRAGRACVCARAPVCASQIRAPPSRQSLRFATARAKSANPTTRSTTRKPTSTPTS